MVMGTEDDRAVGRATGPALLVLLLVVGLVLGGGVSYLLWAGEDGDTSVASEDCQDFRAVRVAVAPSLYGLVTRAIDDIAPPCTRVDPTLLSGGQVALAAANGGELPDVWIADSRFWMSPTYLGPAPGLRIMSPSVARTPVLLVGGPAARRYPSWGEAEVSGQVSVPDPSGDTTGSLAVVAPQAEAAAVGRTMEAAREMTVPFAQQYSERRARGLDEEVGLAALSRRSTRLVVATEQELAEARQHQPYLRDLTPPVGAPVLDFPVAVRQGAAPGSGYTARRLVHYLSGETGAAVLEEEGLRPPDGQAPAEPAAQVSTFLPTPPARAIATTVQSWRTLSVPSAILAVVDASGSMDFPTSTGTRMEVLAGAASMGLSFLPDHARVGLWIFSIDKGGPGQDWRALEPMQRLDRLAFGRTQRYALRERAAELPSLTGGGTGLYDTALAAYRQALRDYRPGYSNAVVLMTDGQNEDPDSIALDALLGRLRALRDPQRPVRIVGIAISQDGDLGALQQMAAATGGEAYLAAEPEDILGVFARAVLSR